MTYLARRREPPRVIPISPHRPSPPEHAVDRARQPNREALETPRERAAVVPFDDEVKVVRLHGELEDTEPPLGRTPEALTESRKDFRSPQRRQVRSRPEGDVHGKAGVMRRSYPMRHADAVAAGLTARALASAAPGPGVKLELNPHLDWGNNSRMLAVCQVGVWARRGDGVPND